MQARRQACDGESSQQCLRRGPRHRACEGRGLGSAGNWPRQAEAFESRRQGWGCGLAADCSGGAGWGAAIVCARVDLREEVEETNV